MITVFFSQTWDSFAAHKWAKDLGYVSLVSQCNPATDLEAYHFAAQASTVMHDYGKDLHIPGLMAKSFKRKNNSGSNPLLKNLFLNIKDEHVHLADFKLPLLGSVQAQHVEATVPKGSYRCGVCR